MAQSKTFGLLLDSKACYAAMQAHDARFDGRFFCGVSSTGIYCRPVCRVKVPKEENCTFYTSAAVAEAAGYRPCMRCRPELAPGLAPVDSVTRLARSAAMIIEEDCMPTRKVTELAIMLGITDRHLRRAFFAEYGVTPVQYLQTLRLKIINVSDQEEVFRQMSTRSGGRVIINQIKNNEKAIRKILKLKD